MTQLIYLLKSQPGVYGKSTYEQEQCIRLLTLFHVVTRSDFFPVRPEFLNMIV